MGKGAIRVIDQTNGQYEYAQISANEGNFELSLHYPPLQRAGWLWGQNRLLGEWPLPNGGIALHQNLEEILLFRGRN